jgi:hypothetical protein
LYSKQNHPCIAKLQQSQSTKDEQSKTQQTKKERNDSSDKNKSGLLAGKNNSQLQKWTCWEKQFPAAAFQHG